jgi:hypothetical protein
LTADQQVAGPDRLEIVAEPLKGVAQTS